VLHTTFYHIEATAYFHTLLNNFATLTYCSGWNSAANP